jgi:tripartite-type tricarboxylate transporter receptor subunit TctC
VKIGRRSLLALLAVGPTAAISQTAGDAQPALKVIVPWAPGGGADTLARTVVAGDMAARMGRSAVVHNKPGASGQVGIQVTVRSPTDGNTLMVTSSDSISIARHLQSLPYDVTRDHSAVAMLAAVPAAIAVSASSPYRTLGDLLKAVKETPLNYATSGSGTLTHLAGELLARLGNVKLNAVPYKRSAPSAVAAMTGEVAEFRQFLETDTKKWGEIVRVANIKADR